MSSRSSTFELKVVTSLVGRTATQWLALEMFPPVGAPHFEGIGSVPAKRPEVAQSNNLCHLRPEAYRRTRARWRALVLLPPKEVP